MVSALIILSPALSFSLLHDVSSDHISALNMMFTLKFTQPPEFSSGLAQYCSPLRQNYPISITILISFPSVTLSHAGEWIHNSQDSIFLEQSQGRCWKKMRPISILHVELKSAKDVDYKDGFDLLNSSDGVYHELIFSPSSLLIWALTFTGLCPVVHNMSSDSGDVDCGRGVTDMNNMSHTSPSPTVSAWCT